MEVLQFLGGHMLSKDASDDEKDGLSKQTIQVNDSRIQMTKRECQPNR